MKSIRRRVAGISMLVVSFVLAALAIRYQPAIEHFIRAIGPAIAVPIATAVFAIVASAPFSVTDALAVMNGAIFGPFWGSIVNALGLIVAGVLGYWIATHATHGMDMETMLSRLPRWVKKFRIGSPAFLIAVRIIPGFGGTVATASAAAFRVPVWIHVLCMCAVAIPVCTVLAIFGDKAVEYVHGVEHRAHMYILHHRPHWRFGHRRRTATPVPTVKPLTGPLP